MRTNKRIDPQRLLFIGLGFELGLVLNHILKLAPYLKNKCAFTRRNSQKANKQFQELGIPFYLDNKEAISDFCPDIIFVGAKPQDLAAVLLDIKESPLNWEYLISIAASTPFDLLCQLFPQKKLTAILPDDVIEMDNPKCIVNFCSNNPSDRVVKAIFQSTCKKLVKVKPSEMVSFNAAICQGNPLLALVVKQYQGDWPLFPEYVKSFFAELIDYLSNRDSVDEIQSLSQQIAKGYFQYAQKFPLSPQLLKEILVLVFDKMMVRTDYQEMDKATLAKQFSLWATLGGLDESGHETVENYIEEGYDDFVQLPAQLMKAIINRGEQLEQQVFRDFKELFREV